MKLDKLPDIFDDAISSSFYAQIGENLTPLYNKERSKPYFEARSKIILSFINALISSGKARVETCPFMDAATNKPRRVLIIELDE